MILDFVFEVNCFGFIRQIVAGLSQPGLGLSIINLVLAFRYFADAGFVK